MISYYMVWYDMIRHGTILFCKAPLRDVVGLESSGASQVQKGGSLIIRLPYLLRVLLLLVSVGFVTG